MLYLIGLGLDWKDVSLKALEALHKCDEIYLESYTSLSNSREKCSGIFLGQENSSEFSLVAILQLEKLAGKKIKVLGRKQTEEEMPFLKDAHLKDVALLIYGDPLSATTHFEIIAEAEKKKVETKIIHAPSIFTAVAETGLSLYRFGKITSIPIPEKNFSPESFFNVLKENLSIGAHTVFLLDLKPDEKKFLAIKDAIKILTEINVKLKEKLFFENTFVVACARLGAENQIIKSGKAKEIAELDFGQPPYCLIVPAKLNHKEEEYIFK